MPTSQDDEWAYKMCKKIAQLTKVIYTLNCKNEDNEERTQWLSRQHMDELSRMKQQHSERLEEAGRQMQELQTAQAKSLANVQSTHTQLLKDAQSDFELKLAKLVTETQRAKSAYDTSLATVRQDSAQHIALEVDKVNKAKDDEIANLVREYNERYKTMLAQQLDEKDALEKTLSEQWSAKVASLEAQLANSQNESAKELAATTIALREREAQVKKLEADTHRLQVQVDELSSSMAQLRRQHDELEARLAAEQRNLATKSSDANEVREQLGELQREIQRVSESLATAEAELQDSKHRADRLQSECGALENEKEVLNTRTKSLEAELAERAAQNDTLHGECESLRKALANLQDATQGNEANLQLHLDEINLLRQRLAELEKDAQDQAAAHQAALTSLEAAHADALRRTGAEVEQFGAARVSELERKLADLEAQHANRVRALESEQAAERAALAAEQTSALEELGREVNVLREKLATAEAALVVSSERCRSLDGEVEQLRSASAQLVDLQARHAALETECTGHLKTIEALEASVAGLSSRQSETAESLKLQIDALEKELASTRERLTQTHAAELEAQRASWEARLAAAEKSHQTLLDSVKAEHVLAMKQMRDSCTRDIASSVRSTKEALDELEATHRKAMAVAAAEAAEKEQALQDRIKALEERLRLSDKSASAKTEENARQIAQLHENIAALQEVQRRKDAEAAAELQRLRQELTQSGQTALDISKAQSEAALEKLRQQSQQAAAAHAAALAKLTEDSDAHMQQKDARHKQAMAEYGEQLARDKKEHITSITSAHERQMEAQRTAADAAVRALQEQLKTSQATVADWERKYAALSRDLTDSRADTEREKSAHTTYRLEAEQRQTSLQQRHELLTRETQDRHAAQLQRVAQEHKGIVDDMMKQHSDEARALQASLDQLRAELEELRHKYLYRESRPEDVDLINQLLKDNKAKEKALAKAYEDMKMYKLELINREESYNKVFGRRPVVADTNPTQTDSSRTHLPAIRTSGTAAAASRTTSQLYH